LPKVYFKEGIDMPKRSCILVLALSLFWGGRVAYGDFYVIAAGKRAKRTVLVSPQSTPAASGTALLEALASITGASAAEPYLLKIEPGIYDIGSNSLQMTPYVDIEGSGENTTEIEGTTAGAVVVGCDHAEIRNLTVENQGGNTFAYGISIVSASPKITNVKVIAKNGQTHTVGIDTRGECSPTMTNVHVTVISTSSVINSAISNYADSSPTMTNVKAEASGNATENIAVRNEYSSNPLMMNVKVDASGGVNSNIGVLNYSSSPTMMNIVSSAIGGGSSENIGIHNDYGSWPSITGSVISAATSGGGTHYGIKNTNTAGKVYISDCSVDSVGYGIYSESSAYTYSTTVTVLHSRVKGTYRSLGNGNWSTLFVGSCLLDGGVENFGVLSAVISCYGCFSASMNPVTCP
jgi:hypothetical protein